MTRPHLTKRHWTRPQSTLPTIGHLTRLVTLAENEILRTSLDPLKNRVARHYLEEFSDCLYHFKNIYDGDIVAAFRKFQDKGYLEIITCGATHGFFPILSVTPNSVEAQVEVAVNDYVRHFHRPPAGIWLPECGYYPGLDNILARYGLRYFYLEAHGLLYGSPRPTFGVHAPAWCPSGVAAFSRDLETSRVVWSQEDGYPGDIYYREFYFDAGHELDWEYLRPHLGTENQRKNIGIKYYRITDRHSSEKMIYEPDVARVKADAHATHFHSERCAQVRRLNAELGKKPLIVSPYDAELFGHWWYEGPIWLDALIRKFHHYSDVKMILPTEYLATSPDLQTVQPCQSSWGDKGYHEFWINDKNDWIYKHVHEASARMVEMARSFPEAHGLLERLLNQSARELLLAQASDWPFILRTGTTVSYAEKRIRTHLARFTKIYTDVKTRTIDRVFLEEIEDMDNLFPDINFRVYAK